MIRIVSMSSSHLNALAQLEAECFSEPWTVEGLRSELENKNAIFLVAEDDDRICGYVGMHNILGECYITNIAVNQNFRGQGIGHSLLQALEVLAIEHDAEFISLEVRVSNKPAIALYKKNGYQQVGERKDFYTKPLENALIMTKFLRGESLG